MKPLWKDGKLAVELHKPEIATLQKAREIGMSLDALHQATGAALVAAVDAVIGTEKGDGVPLEV